LLLLRQDVATVIRKSGVTIPPGTSPETTMGTACANHTPDCQKIRDALKAERAAVALSDGTGKGTFPGVPPGTYYLMIATRFNNQTLRWGFKVDLKSGPNSVTLDQSNGVPVN
jgi:hypothetical protein